MDRIDTADVFAGLTRTVREKLGYYVSYQPPQFMMNTVDWMTYVEEDDSDYMYADEDVPFYQIVVHGSAVYSGNAYNYMYDTSQQSLKAVEYGYVPFYELTKETPYELRMSMLKNNFYSTVIDDWYDRVVQTYKQYEKDFADIWNVQITSHQRLSDKVSCTTYANGVKVYVNYDKAAVTLDGVTIAAEGYVVVR